MSQNHRPAAPAIHPASVYQIHLVNAQEAQRRGIRPIHKLLVANRSEIAIRVFRTSSAWALTSYLESVDSAKRGGPRVAAKPPAATTGTSRSSLRPPMPVPTR